MNKLICLKKYCKKKKYCKENTIALIVVELFFKIPLYIFLL